MIESHPYEIHLDGTSPKTGVLTGPRDGLPTLHVASPPQFGGPEHVWSPEHLFVASVSACLMTTFRAIAANSNLEVLDYSDDAVGNLVQDEDRRFRIDSVLLRPRVVIADPNRVDRALRFLEKAEEACLISRSLRCTVSMEAAVEVGQPV